MLFPLETDLNAVLTDYELVLSLQNLLQVLFVEVDSPEFVDYLIDGLDQLHSLLKVFGPVNLFG